MDDRVVRELSRLHRVVYRVSGGRLGGTLRGLPMLLLTTTGRRTGRSHTVPLLYLEEGASLVVIASYGGRPHHPDWYRNLEAEPRAEVQVDGERWGVRARRAGPAERERLWPRVVAIYPDYRVYQGRTDRVIPVVLLDPLEEELPA